jgi:hypothetical protein
MQAGDVTQTLEVALQVSGCQSVGVEHKPRLLSDNGACYISQELALWLEGQGMGHVRGAPNHPANTGQARFTLAQYPNNLAFRKFRLPHPSSPKKWKSLFSSCSPFGGAYAVTGRCSVVINDNSSILIELAILMIVLIWIVCWR